MNKDEKHSLQVYKFLSKCIPHGHGSLQEFKLLSLTKLQSFRHEEASLVKSAWQGAREDGDVDTAPLNRKDEDIQL